MSNHPEEVLAAVRALFRTSDEATVLDILDLYGVEPHECERERVQVAVVALSGGNEEKLLYFVEAAKVDYRDVLYWHETGPLTPEQSLHERDAIFRLMAYFGNSPRGTEK
jgi:hypothetical protein